MDCLCTCWARYFSRARSQDTLWDYTIGVVEVVPRPCNRPLGLLHRSDTRHDESRLLDHKSPNTETKESSPFLLRFQSDFPFTRANDWIIMNVLWISSLICWSVTYPPDNFYQKTKRSNLRNNNLLTFVHGVENQVGPHSRLQSLRTAGLSSSEHSASNVSW